MKISYFTTHYPYQKNIPKKIYPVGGAETVVENLAKRLTTRGHEVHVFTTSFNSKSCIEKHENLWIHRYGTNLKLASGRFSTGLMHEPMRYPTDIVHVHVSVPMGDIAGFFYAKKKKKPLVVTLHLDVGSYKNIMIKLAYYIYCGLINKFLTQADIIVSPTRSYVNDTNLKRHKDKIIIIPNGIDIKKFDIKYSKDECREKLSLSLSEKIILYVGNLEPRKGLDILIRAMAIVVRVIKDVRLIVIGSGVMLDNLQKLVIKLGLSQHVIFTGFAEDNKKLLYYKSADIFVLPSLYEIFGIVNLEAMACGLPIIATKVGGIPDIVEDGSNGLLVPYRNPKALADAIIYLLENDDVRKKMGKKSYCRVKEYSWENIVEKTETLYNGLIK